MKCAVAHSSIKCVDVEKRITEVPFVQAEKKNVNVGI